LAELIEWATCCNLSRYSDRLAPLESYSLVVVSHVLKRGYLLTADVESDFLAFLLKVNNLRFTLF